MKERKLVNRPLLHDRIRRLNVLCEALPDVPEITLTAGWLVMQSCAGSKWSAFWWIIKDSINSQKLHLWAWWNFSILRRHPDDIEF